jgi:hypothetical protein
MERAGRIHTNKFNRLNFKPVKYVDGRSSNQRRVTKACQGTRNAPDRPQRPAAARFNPDPLGDACPLRDVGQTAINRMTVPLTYTAGAKLRRIRSVRSDAVSFEEFQVGDAFKSAIKWFDTPQAGGGPYHQRRRCAALAAFSSATMPATYCRTEFGL